MEEDLMNVLAIMGSPHKGASYALTQQIENKLTKLTDVDFSYLHLKDVHLEPCRGCFACFLKGKEACPLKDEKELIEEKIDNADGVIFVSPVYSMHVTYLMKIFIDRFSYTFHRPRYFGKYALAVATTGNLGLKETLKYLRGVALCWGFSFTGQIGAVRPPKPLPIIKREKDTTERVVQEFYRAMREKKPRKLTFIDHLMFHSTRRVYEHLQHISPVPRDFTYWNEKGMFDKGKKYFVDGRNSFFGNMLASLLSRPISSQMSRAINRQAED
jgi:multimeric flavodoxin WrbA